MISHYNKIIALALSVLSILTPGRAHAAASRLSTLARIARQKRGLGALSSTPLTARQQPMRRLRDRNGVSLHTLATSDGDQNGKNEDNQNRKSWWSTFLGFFGLGTAYQTYKADMHSPWFNLAHADEEEQNRAKEQVGCNMPQFDREKMVEDIEGYWATHPDPALDDYKGKYPFPKKNPKPWPTQEEFLKKLESIETLAQSIFWAEYTPQIGYNTYRGASPSRFEKGVYVGCRKFRAINPHTGQTVSWPEGFGSYYVAKFNVMPSKEFYDFIMNYPIEDAEITPVQDVYPHNSRVMEAEEPRKNEPKHTCLQK